MDCINREALLQDISESVLFTVREGADLPNAEMRGANKVIDRIKSAPVVDGEKVKRAEWELRHVGHGHYWECSVCHTNPCIYVTKDTKFCPNCGARMDGGKTE